MRSDQYIETVLEKCSALMAAGLWRREPAVRPRAWLSNFDDEDQAVAAVLLDHFTYFASSAVDQMLLSLYRQLRDGLISNMGIERAIATLDSAVFTSVEGEDPNVTDSGNLFCRKLRQTASIADQRFMGPDRALEHAKAGRLVVFLDDILGSGGQITSTWTRDYHNQQPYSFADLEAQTGVHVIYATLVATRTGLDRLRAEVAGLTVVAAHIVDAADTVTGVPRSALRPDIDDIPGAIANLLEKYSPRLRVPAYLEEPRMRMYGHSESGLLVAFEHSTPDSTLPIFWAVGPDQWTPLVRRV
ncbi:phosphoribosyltransferase-like protein [Ralstonia nicotianae]